MTKTLDRSRPHGTIHPPYEGAHYEQGGFHFDAQGKLVEKLLTPEQKAALAKAAQPKSPRASEQEPSGAPKPPKPNAVVGTEDFGSSASASDQAATQDGVNLEEWLRDDASANFLEVRKAVKARYATWITDKAGVVTFLVNEQHLLPAEELDPDLRKLLPQA